MADGGGVAGGRICGEMPLGRDPGLGPYGNTGLVAEDWWPVGVGGVCIGTVIRRLPPDWYRCQDRDGAPCREHVDRMKSCGSGTLNDAPEGGVEQGDS